MLTKLKRRLNGDLEYVRIFEWMNGRIHSHLWVRTDQLLTSAQIEELFPDTPSVGFKVTCAPRRKGPTAAANYLFKHTRNPAKKADLPPVGFNGKLFVASRRFFVRPIATLWREVKDGWKEQHLARTPVTDSPTE